MKQRKIILEAALVTILVIAGAQIASAPADAATIRTSAVCTRSASYCMGFNYFGALPVVTSITFVAPTQGTALVSNGSMQCINDSTINDFDHGVVDLSTQIVNDATPPNYQEPGGGRIALRLPPATGASFPTAINLASSPVVALTPGSHKFNFKIARNRMDQFTYCYVFNGNFDVVFVP